MNDVSIEYYVTDDGEKPFLNWFNKLSIAEQVRIDKYIYRVAIGGSKTNIKAIKDGVYEIKIYHGPGYRVYFAKDDEKIILLLLGGDKASQKRDINKAKKYWRDYAQKK